MVLSKRERYIAIAALSAVGLLGLDHFILGPLILARADLDSKISEEQQKLENAQRLFRSRRHQAHLWADMQNNGLRRKDASEAESQVLNSIRDWAQEAGMSLSSVKPERMGEKEKDFLRSTFRATGTGGMAQISRFLWHIQTATIPVRVADMQINARKENLDDLTLQIGISTIYLPPDAGKELTAAMPAREVQP